MATGSGNAAIAGCGCAVTGTDYVPELLERGRARAAAEGLEVTWAEADAEDLPYADGEFDAVLSSLGVMFAPDQEQAAAELVRVCRPGGTIALANWTPDSFVGGILRTVGNHVPPPAGVRPPSQWGTEERLRELIGDAVSDLRITRREFMFRFRSPEEFTEFFRDNYGPTLKAFRGPRRGRPEAALRRPDRPGLRARPGARPVGGHAAGLPGDRRHPQMSDP